MRIAILASNTIFDKKLSNYLQSHNNTVTIINKYTYSMGNKFDFIVFSHYNKLPSLPKLIENIALDESTHIIYVSNNDNTAPFYNLLSDVYFSFITEDTIYRTLQTYMQNTFKFMKEIYQLNNEVSKLYDKLDTNNHVSKAKFKLIEAGYTESEAHKFIIKGAMQQRITLKMFSRKILLNSIDF